MTKIQWTNETWLKRPSITKMNSFVELLTRLFICSFKPFPNVRIVFRTITRKASRNDIIGRCFATFRDGYNVVKSRCVRIAVSTFIFKSFKQIFLTDCRNWCDISFPCIISMPNFTSETFAFRIVTAIFFIRVKLANAGFYFFRTQPHSTGTTPFQTIFKFFIAFNFAWRIARMFRQTRFTFCRFPVITRFIIAEQRQVNPGFTGITMFQILVYFCYIFISRDAEFFCRHFDRACFRIRHNYLHYNTLQPKGVF